MPKEKVNVVLVCLKHSKSLYYKCYFRKKLILKASDISYKVIAVISRWYFFLILKLHILIENGPKCF